MTAELQHPFIVAVFDRPLGATPAPTRLGWLPAVSNLSYRRAFDGAEWARFRIPAVNAPTWLRQTHVVRIAVIGDETVSGAVEEYRIKRLLRRGDWIEVEAVGLLEDFAMCGPLYVEENGSRLYTFTRTLTVADWVALILTHAGLRGFSYWIAGTIEPTDTLEMTVSNETPLAVLRRITSGQENIGAWELVLALDAAAGLYKLHIVEEYNGTAPTLRVFSGQNLSAVEDLADSAEFMSGIAPRGVQGTTSAAEYMGQTLWKVSSVATGPHRIVVADPGGDAAIRAIKVNDQFNAVGVPVVVQCIRTGRRYDVSDSVESTQELYLSDTAQLSAGDLVELFYVPAGTTLTKMHYRPQNVTNTSGRRYCMLKVGTVTGASLRFQALDPSTSTVSSILTGRNSGLNGSTMKRFAVVATGAATNFNSSTNVLTVASTTGMQVGDAGTLTISASGYVAYDMFTIKQVLTGTTIEIEQRYEFAKGVAFIIPNGALSGTSIRILREQAETYYVTKHTGSVNFGADPQQNIWLDHVTNLTAGDYFECYIEVGGTSVTELFDPVALVTYPQGSGTNVERRTRNVSFAQFGGEPQMFPLAEAFFENLTDAYGNLWTSTPSRVANTTAGGKHGTYSTQSTSWTGRLDHGQTSTTDDSKSFRIGRLLRNPYSGSGRLILAAYVRDATFDFSVWDLDGQETFRCSFSGGSSAAHALYAMAVDPTATSVGSGISRLGSVLSQGFIVGFSNVEYADAWTAYWSPDGTIKADDVFHAFGGGRVLWSKGNDYLALYATPPRSVDCDIVDLWRLDRTKYAGQRVLLGNPIQVYHETTGTDLSARVTATETRFGVQMSARLHVEIKTRQEALSDRLATE